MKYTIDMTFYSEAGTTLKITNGEEPEEFFISMNGANFKLKYSEVYVLAEMLDKIYKYSRGE